MRRFALLLVLLTRSIASAADPLPPGAVLRLGDVRFRAAGEVRQLRFSDDGTALVGWAIDRDGKLHPVAWETSTGVPLPPLPDHAPQDAPGRSTPAVRLDRNRVLTAGPGCAGRVWDATTGRQLALLTGHTTAVTAVAATVDGRRLATGSADGFVRVWDAESFRPLSSPSGHTGPVRTIRVSADGARAVSTGDDQTARVWDLVTGRELRAFPCSGVADLTAGGTSVILAVRTASVRDVLTGLEVVSAQPPACPMATIPELLTRLGVTMAVSPDGRMMAIAHPDATVGLYEVATGQQRRSLVGYPSVCHAIAFTPDGCHLLTGGADHTILVWAIRVQDVPLPRAIQRETRAAKLWTTMTAGPADSAYLAMARLAAEPPAAVKMARLHLQPAEAASTDVHSELADRRAVELLESLGTLAAREFLEELATGVSDARLTREARQALERLSDVMGGGKVR